MAEQKLNCWEYMQCGHEPGSTHTDELGTCPASTDVKHDGTNGGTNSGRYCWAIAGTFCRGEVQDNFARKLSDCTRCPFYCEVERQEERRFVLYMRD
jgi:hypothetical protein